MCHIVQICFSIVQSDLMDTVVAVAHMKNTTTPEVDGMSRAIKRRHLLTQGNQDSEDGRYVVEEPLWWERKGSHVSVTGGPRIMIHLSPILRKRNTTTARGGLLSPGWTAPLMTSMIHTRAALPMDPKGAHRSTATILVTGHPRQDIFAAIQLIGGQALHPTATALSGVTKGSQVFCIRSSGIDTHVEVTVPEEGPMSCQVMAWSAGMRVEGSPIHTMESTGPLVHRGAPERCIGEAQCQRGTRVKQQPQLARIVIQEA